MPAQSDQTNSPPEESKADTSLETFIDQLVKEKKYPAKMDPQVIEKIKTDLQDLLQRTINAKILARMEEEDRKEFVQMVENKATEKETQDFIKEKIPDIDSFLIDVLSNFRKKYLGKI